jgi:putative flippase GtrA
VTGAHHETLRSVISYFGVGAAGALAYVVLSTVMTTLTGVSPWICSVLVYLGLILPVYFAQHRLTFRSQQAHRTSLPRYIAIQMLGVFLAAILPRLLSASALPPGAIFAAVALTIAVTNYGLLRFWAFATR